jgi:hypothetical protein
MVNLSLHMRERSNRGIEWKIKDEPEKREQFQNEGFAAREQGGG